MRNVETKNESEGKQMESLKKTKIGEEGMPKEMKEKKRASEGEKRSVSQPKHRKRQSQKEKGKKHLLTEMRSLVLCQTLPACEQYP